VINPQAGALAALSYANGAGNAAIQAAGTGGRGSLVMLGFPFETITTAANRAAVMDRVFDFFALAPPPSPNADFNGDGTVNAADYTVWRDSKGANVAPGELGDADFNGQVDQQDYIIWKQQFGTSPGAGGGAGAGDAAVESLAPAAAALVEPSVAKQSPSLASFGLDSTTAPETLARGHAVDRPSRRTLDAAFESGELLLVAYGRSPEATAGTVQELELEASERPTDIADPGPLNAELVRSLRRLR
jgi:hypothetical protein